MTLTEILLAVGVALPRSGRSADINTDSLTGRIGAGLFAEHVSGVGTETPRNIH